MVTTWTAVAKASGTGWTKVSAQGLTAFDDPLVPFDSPSMPFDGNRTQWTDIPKASNGSTITAGTATGLLMPPTYAEDISITDIWTKINKAT